MGFGLKRADLQSLAQARFDDSLFLWQGRRYSSAYYLAGYAVELGLKACISRQVFAETIPDKYFLNTALTHSFDKLIGLAGLRTDFDQEIRNNSNFAASWAIINEWTPDSRYEVHDKSAAQFLIEAIGNEKNGLLPWIKTHW